MLANIGSTELIVIVLVLIVVFGTNKISGLARGLGETTKEFKKVQKEYEKSLKDVSDEVEKKISDVKEE